MSKSFSSSFVVDQSPEEVFNAVTNVRGWWSEAIEGNTDKVGDVFWYHYRDAHRSTMKLIERTEGERVVWRCLDNYFDFIADKTEWFGTELQFDIAEKDGKTHVTFTHEGLVPDYECFDVCSSSWGMYTTNSLKSLIVSGTGNPNPKE